MANNLYRCTRCNTEFNFNTDREALFCPLCGSTAKLISSGLSYNNITSTSSSSKKRRYVSTDFVDRSTNLTVGSATVPSDWSVETQIQKYSQSEAEPYLKLVKLINPEQTTTIIVRSGDDYLDVRNGIGENEVHQDGQVDKYFNTPMKRFMDFASYVDELASGFVGNKKLTRTGSAKLKSYLGSNEATAKKAVQAEANELGTKFKNSQLRYEVKAVAVDSTVNTYKYKNGRYDGILVVGSDIGAYEYHLTPANASGGGDIMSLFNSFLGNNAQQNEGIYINWGSKLVFCMATDNASYEEAVEVFNKFVSTYKETADLNKKIAKLGQNTSSQSLFGSGRPQNNNNGSSQSGSSFTEMLMNILGNSFINRGE
ncbi:MAG: zinc ribbon domain-containing protein [Erysipelotrichaceae bacterium]|nr:zinc ribbon domain-containing protein [Erysipelotrichaceae bacterium]